MQIDALHRQIVHYTASRLLATYVQSGELDTYAVDDVLARSGVAVGQYRIRDLRTLARLGFLLSKSTRCFASDVARQMQTLRASSQRHFDVVDGHVRGAINWSQTVPLQVTRPTCFVCADPQRAFDLPENHMLRAVVESHHDDLGRVQTRWPTMQGQAPSGWRRELCELGARLHAIKNNPYYQRIPRSVARGSLRLPSRLVQKVRRRRSRLAALILRQYLAYRAACGDTPQPHALRQALIDGLRWPNPHKLFELFSLFSLLHLVEQRAVARPDIVPIHSRVAGDCWFARLRSADTLVTVYYQTVPPDLRIHYAADAVDATIREYAEMLHLYGARLGSLRPDAVIDCQRGRHRRLLLVEVKHSKALPTVRQGLRELVDYCHLVRSRTTAAFGPTEIRGLLCVLDLPTPKLVFPAASVSGSYAITSAARLLGAVEGSEAHDELQRVASFCWFAQFPTCKDPIPPDPQSTETHPESACAPYAPGTRCSARSSWRPG